jgi:hypothetical protein
VTGALVLQATIDLPGSLEGEDRYREVVAKILNESPPTLNDDGRTADVLRELPLGLDDNQ